MEQILLWVLWVGQGIVCYEIEKLKTVVGAKKVGGAVICTACSHPPKRADLLRFGALRYFSPGAVLELTEGKHQRNSLILTDLVLFLTGRTLFSCSPLCGPPTAQNLAIADPCPRARSFNLSDDTYKVIGYHIPGPARVAIWYPEFLFPSFLLPAFASNPIHLPLWEIK